jgi:hypothetical protein
MCRLAAIVEALYVIALIASLPASAQDRGGLGEGPRGRSALPVLQRVPPLG